MLQKIMAIWVAVFMTGTMTGFAGKIKWRRQQDNQLCKNVQKWKFYFN